MMSNKRDEIYNSDGLKSSQARSVLFPILLKIVRSTCESSIAESQRIVEQLQQEIGKYRSLDVDLQLGDFTVDREDRKVQINLMREGKNIHLQIQFFCILMLPEPIDFWSKNLTISRCADFLHEICEVKRGKDVELCLGKTVFPNSKSYEIRASV